MSDLSYADRQWFSLVSPQGCKLHNIPLSCLKQCFLIWESVKSGPVKPGVFLPSSVLCGTGYENLWKSLVRKICCFWGVFTQLCLCLYRSDEVQSNRLRKQRLKLAKDHTSEPVHSDVPRTVDMGALCIWALSSLWWISSQGLPKDFTRSCHGKLCPTQRVGLEIVTFLVGEIELERRSHILSWWVYSWWEIFFLYIILNSLGFIYWQATLWIAILQALSDNNYAMLLSFHLYCSQCIFCNAVETLYLTKWWGLKDYPVKPSRFWTLLVHLTNMETPPVQGLCD